MALPPTVAAPIIEVIIIVVIVLGQLNVSAIVSVRTAPKLPDTIPQISPITSLHIEETFVEFFTAKSAKPSS